jgi:hypothetical protein
LLVAVLNLLPVLTLSLLVVPVLQLFLLSMLFMVEVVEVVGDIVLIHIKDLLAEVRCLEVLVVVVEVEQPFLVVMVGRAIPTLLEVVPKGVKQMVPQEQQEQHKYMEELRDLGVVVE